MKTKFIVLFTTLLSLVGIALQLWAQTTAFAPVTNLPVDGAPALIALTVFTALTLVLTLAVALPWRDHRPADLPLYPADSRLLPLLGGGSAAVFTLGGVLSLVETLPGQNRGQLAGAVSAVAVCLILILGGAAMFRLSLVKKCSKPVEYTLWPLLPGFAGCFRLVIFYHSHSRDALVLTFCWTLISLLCAIVALYFQAGYCFGHKKPLFALWFTAAGAATAFTALPSAESPAHALLTLGMAGWMVLHCVLLPNASERHGHREQQ